MHARIVEPGGNEVVTTAELSVLGPLEVAGLTPGERRLLAALALRSGQIVRVDEALDALWGERPPLTARKALQNHVVRLRQRLGHDAITTEPGGYRLMIGTDVATFERLARVEPERALGLWRGEPWLDLEDWEPAAVDRARLLELKLLAEEGAAERRLDVAEAERLVRETPLRERRWCLLLRALYVAGRQAEALRAAQRARAMLRDELGLEPGPELRATEAAVARQDPDLLALGFGGAVSPEQALSLGVDAFERDDYVLASQWLRMAAPSARPVLARALFAAGDSDGGITAVTDSVAAAIGRDDLAAAVDALVALAVGRGPSITTPAIDRAFASVRSRADELDDDQRTCLAAAEVLARAYSTGRDALASLLAEAAACNRRTDRAAYLASLAALVGLDRPHDAAERLRLLEALAPSGEPDLDRLGRWFHQHLTLWSLLELGDPRQEDARAEVLDAAARTRHVVERANAASWAGRGILDGDLDAAEQEAVHWLGPYASHEGLGLATIVHGSFLFTVRWMQGRLGELLPMLEAAVAAMPEVATWRSAYAMALAESGRVGDARELLATFFGEGLRIDVGYGLWSATAFHLTETIATVGAMEEAADLLCALEPIADLQAFYSCHHLGSFHHHLAALHRCLGDTAMARAHFEQAVAAHEALGSRWWLARSRRELDRLS